MYRTLHRIPVVVVAALLLSFCAGKSTPTSPTPASCTYALSTSSLSLGSGGGPASVTVTTGTQCGWTATTDRSWMTIVSGASGTGNGVVNLQVEANGQSDRSGTVTVGGQTVSVQQTGAAPCAFTITPASASFSKDAATGGFDITTAGSCAWAVTMSPSWVTFTSPTHGTGSAHVAYAIDSNRDTTERRGAIAVADQTFTIVQAGDAGACEYSVGPVSVSACMASPASLSTTITTSATCSWTAGTDSSWITLSGAGSGTGSSVVTFTLAPNWDAPRTGKVMLRWPTPTAGQNVVVSQAGCRYAVSTTSLSAPVGGASLNFNVVQQSDPMECGGPLQNACQWTATPNVPWITVTTSMPQAGDNPVQFTVAPNGTGAPRTGTITVRDKTVTITQAGI